MILAHLINLCYIATFAFGGMDIFKGWLYSQGQASPPQAHSLSSESSLPQADLPTSSQMPAVRRGKNSPTRILHFIPPCLHEQESSRA
ncbi:hypothetical protein B484DRAFT_166079 [Ochromonadaceae sp. CCMP2298]|nr:hypothetical protein B484DRAFT_166079 [Ochromonadaceae sp. CCMP2298]